MWTEEQKDRLRATSMIFVFTTIVVFAVAVLAARLSAQTPQVMPATRVTASRLFASGENATIKGLITSRNGDDMMIRDENGAMDVVTLTADTKISSPSGLFKLEKRSRDVSDLLPGLIVEVKGSGGDRNNLVADRISFHGSALRVAQQIAAGTVAFKMAVGDSLSGTNRRITDSIAAVRDSIASIEARARDSLSAIHARFDDLDKYDMRQTTTVFFSTNSTSLGEADRQQLDALAASAMALDGFLIEVKGYADSQGTEAHNQELSQARSQAVIDYLVTVRNVPIRRVLNPTGFGEADPAASNATASGRAQNRRVEVKVLVNRGTK